MNVVITGSTKGIGLGMAREFLKRGHDIMISSRRPEAVDDVVARLRDEAPDRQVAGRVCDVAEYGQVQNLWDRAVEIFGSVDIWVNNAGRDAPGMPFFALPRREIEATIRTNMLGLMYCNQIVINGMYEQGGGKIFNMEGFGSNGMTRPRASVYGSTKYALRYFTKTLVQELRNTPVKMGYLSPGIVITDLLVPPPEHRGKGWEEAKKTLNLLADSVETVTPYLVDGMISTKENGTAVRWLTPRKILWRKIQSIFKKRDVFTPLGL